MKLLSCFLMHSFFYKNVYFKVEAERSYIFVRFEAENVLDLTMFSYLYGINIMKTGQHGLPSWSFMIDVM